MPGRTVWNNLLKETQNGDLNAREELFRKLEVRLRPFAQFRLQGWSVQDIDDIVQDALTVFTEKVNDIKSNPHDYAIIILRNKIGDALGERRRRKNISIQSGEEKESDRSGSINEQTFIVDGRGNDPAARLEDRDMVDHIYNTIKNLPDFCRTIFLGLLEGKTVQEFWQFFKGLEPDLKRSAFDKRIYDCRRKLKDLIEA
jgi:RNA polymerase sigma factor (sigma-70 family)